MSEQEYLVELRPGSLCVQALSESLAETSAAGRLLQCGTWNTASPQISSVPGNFTDRGDQEAEGFERFHGDFPSV